MKRSVAGYIVVCLLVFAGSMVIADDANNSEDLNVELVAPVQAFDATTITVLGMKLTIPTSTDGTGHKSRKGGSDDGSGGSGGGDGGSGGGTTTTTFVVGQWVKIEFASDASPLTPREIKDFGGYAQTLKIHAPLQAVDATAKTIKLIGLTIDVSSATIDGGNDSGTQTVAGSLSDLAVGQQVEAILDPAKLPAYVATKVQIRNLTNKVDCHVEDEHGVEQEHLNDDMSVDAMQNVKVIDPVTGKKVKKTIQVHTVTRNGKFSLAGLLPGKAKVIYTIGGKSKSKTVTISADGAAVLTLKLKK